MTGLTGAGDSQWLLQERWRGPGPPSVPKGLSGATSTWDPLQHTDDSVSQGHWPARAPLIFCAGSSALGPRATEAPLPLGWEPGIPRRPRDEERAHSPGHMTTIHVELWLLLGNLPGVRPRLPAPGVWPLRSPQTSPPTQRLADPAHHTRRRH